MKEREITGERWNPKVQNETAIEHLHRYALAREFSAGKAVLDIACGEGYGTRLLAENASSVTGIDIDNKTIELAKKRYATGNIQFLRRDATNTQLPDATFDLIVSFETLEHIEDHAGFMKEIKRLLKPDGLLLISTPDKTEYSEKSGHKNPFHVKELNRTEFEILISASFRNFNMLYQKSALCSHIFNPGQKELDLYTGNHNQLDKIAPEAWVYLIAIASEYELPALNNSLFYGTSVLQAALEEQAAKVRETITYRVGNLILWPIKQLKNQLLKNKSIK